VPGVAVAFEERGRTTALDRSRRWTHLDPRARKPFDLRLARLRRLDRIAHGRAPFRFFAAYVSIASARL
jgi:hypothetical protein